MAEQAGRSILSMADFAYELCHSRIEGVCPPESCPTTGRRNRFGRSWLFALLLWQDTLDTYLVLAPDTLGNISEVL